MSDVRQELRQLAQRAKELHSREHKLSFESVILVGELDRRNVAVNMNMSAEAFAKYIGLSTNQYWKRAQAARVMRRFPEAQRMLKDGETEITHLALVAPKITQANSKVLLNKMKNKSKREIEGFLSQITSDGRVLEKEPELELRIKFTKSQFELLDRAREILSHGGHVPSLREIVVKGLGDLLDKRDPLRKAVRAAARQEKSTRPSPAKDATEVTSTTSETPSPAKEGRTHRPAIPAAVRHAVWRRDGGRCTWRYPDGSRCEECSMLELDHIVMWCHGGQNSVANLTLRCRRHNQFAAELQLGTEFMEIARSAATPNPHLYS